jgi:hypothetical protein
MQCTLAFAVNALISNLDHINAAIVAVQYDQILGANGSAGWGRRIATKFFSAKLESNLVHRNTATGSTRGQTRFFAWINGSLRHHGGGTGALVWSYCTAKALIEEKRMRRGMAAGVDVITPSKAIASEPAARDRRCGSDSKSYARLHGRRSSSTWMVK